MTQISIVLRKFLNSAISQKKSAIVLLRVSPAITVYSNEMPIPPGGCTWSQTDGYVRSEIGGLKKDPYSDSHGPKIRPLQGPVRYIGYPYTDFHMYILHASNSKTAPAKYGKT